MGQIIDIKGQRFGVLTVIGLADRKRWECRCDCGSVRLVLGQSLRRGATKSCGCQIRLHGILAKGQDLRSKTREYQIWRSMRDRCYTPSQTSFQKYGARGIAVCDRWLNSFDAFLSDMGPRPSPKHSIERRDPDGNYEPANCYWAPPLEQANNKRNTRRVVYRGREMALHDAARLAGGVVHPQTAWNRIVRTGWTVEDAVETPAVKPQAMQRRRWAS